MEAGSAEDTAFASMARTRISELAKVP
jgi:hypothetical protein